MFIRTRFHSLVVHRKELDPLVHPIARFSSEKKNSDKDGKSEEKSEPTAKVHRSTVASTAETIGSATLQYTHEINKVYHDMEQTLMRRINESNTQRFRLFFFGSLLAVVWIGSVFGSSIRAHVAKETAGLAKETLEDEQLKVQTQELATAVVQTVLTDKEVTARAALFLQQAAGTPQTQEALLALLLHLLQHPDTQRELAAFGARLAQDLSRDQSAIDAVAQLLARALLESSVVAALSHALVQLCADPPALQALSTLLIRLGAREDVSDAVRELLEEAAQGVLVNEEVRQLQPECCREVHKSQSQVARRSRALAAEVVGDAGLQREGGHALWNSVVHALRPGVSRLLGVGLMLVSIGLMRVLLSPF
ncbi:unnamed protein product [Sphagnum jensenii]|uniref:Uncharacterized protein n=1 Tax=Sphagnum jensenii TaxID=128206 RepID=A0ABP0VFH3_9BRYO